MNIETSRTLLRPFQIEDLEDLHAYTSQQGVGEMAGWKHHTSINETFHTLNYYRKNENVSAIVSKEKGAVIGHIAVYQSAEGSDVPKAEYGNVGDAREIGFAINKEYQGQGIMTEVLTAVLAQLKSEGMTCIHACCIKENEGAAHLLEKCGFQMERECSITSKSLKKKFECWEYLYCPGRKKDRTVKTVLMNLCMICDGSRVLVQDKVNPEYPGITFPGGHVENQESFVDAVIREVKEETGLSIENPKLCGVKGWQSRKDQIRYIVFLYQTDKFQGELIPSEEGNVFWAEVDELSGMNLAEGMEETLQLYLRDDIWEYYAYEEGNDWKYRLQ